MSPPAQPRPAATVVLLRATDRGLEVLLTQRPATMAFAANMHVFPGGAVDDGDGDDRITAVRELFEEAGVLLADARGTAPGTEQLSAARASLLEGNETITDVARALGVNLRPDLLVPLSRWVTPPFVDRRFDVGFFAAELPPGASPSFVGDEVVAHRWLTPRAALDERAAGRIGLWVPTSATLQQLEHVSSFAEIRERLGPGPSAEPIRTVEEAAGLIRVVLPGAGGVDGQSVNAYVVGRRELVVVDPGDPSDAAAETLIEVARARDGTIVGVALTHADPDHAAGAEALAGRLGIPIFGGPGSGHDLPHDVVELSGGRRVPVGDVELVVLPTPGHRPDHVALAGDGFVVAGDLVGPGPARSLLGPPDVPAWLASLDRLSARRSHRLLPGHGEPGAGAAVAAAIADQRARLGVSPRISPRAAPR